MKNPTAGKLFELKFIGGDISPDKISSHELAELIISFEESMVGLIKRENKDFNEENLIISLVDVEEGSLKLKFKPKIFEIALPAFIAVSSSIKSNNFTNLPYKSVKALSNISTFCKTKKCSVELRKDTHSNKPTATIYAEHEITVPQDLFIVGETTIYGRVVRVGGIEPKVSISLSKGETLFCSITEALAKQIGKGLYEEVGIKGTATWLKEDYSIIDFKIDSFFPIDRTSLTSTFTELNKILGKYWEDVTDVEGEIAKIRGYTLNT